MDSAKDGERYRGRIHAPLQFQGLGHPDSPDAVHFQIYQVYVTTSDSLSIFHSCRCEWLGERVAQVDAKKVVENVLRNKPTVGWGPNAVFRFPLQGGTGAIWKKVAGLLPERRQSYKKKVVHVDADQKTVHLDDGSTIAYQKLLSTVPLDTMCGWVGKPEMAHGLRYS